MPETPRDDSGTGFGWTLRHSGEKGAAVANRRRDPVERQRAHTRHQCVPVGPTRRSRLPVLPKRNPSAGAECPARPRGRFSGKCSYVVGSISSQDGQVSVGRYSCHVNARNHRRACEPAAEGRQQDGSVELLPGESLIQALGELAMRFMKGYDVGNQGSVI